MSTPTSLLRTVNCAAIGDRDIHHIQVSANSTVADLKMRLAAASPALMGLPMESFILLLVIHRDGRWLSTHDPEIQTITSAVGIESLLIFFDHDLPDSTLVAQVVLLEEPNQSTDIHILAYPLGNTQRVNGFTDRLRWLRHLQTAAATVLVPSTIWAAVEALDDSESTGTAACVTAIATAITGAATTAIQFYERRRARAISEADTAPIFARVV